MQKLPKAAKNPGQVNADLSKALTKQLVELYPGCQVKIKGFSFATEALSPPALDVKIVIALEIAVKDESKQPPD